MSSPPPRVPSRLPNSPTSPLQAAADKSANAPPPLTAAALLTILAEVALGAEASVATIDAACRSGPEASRIAPDTAAAALAADLTELQEGVFAAHGTNSAAVDAAFAYYSAGRGRDKRIVEAGASLRRALGKHLLTPGRLLGCLRDMFLWQVSHMDELAADVMAAVEGGADPAQVLQVVPLAKAGEFTQSRVGLTLEQLMGRAQAMGEQDPAFGQRLSELMERGQAAVSSAMQENATLASLFQGGM